MRNMIEKTLLMFPHEKTRVEGIIKDWGELTYDYFNADIVILLSPGIFSPIKCFCSFEEHDQTRCRKLIARKGWCLPWGIIVKDKQILKDIASSLKNSNNYDDDDYNDDDDSDEFRYGR